MKGLFAGLVFFFGILMVCARKRECTIDESLCRIGECCVLNFQGSGKICKEPGDDIGDLCGGDYFCAGCDKGLICQPLEIIDNVVRPANGTCQMPLPKSVPSLDEIRLMIAEELQKAVFDPCAVLHTREPLI